MTVWLQLSIEVVAPQAEGFCDRLDELGAVAVTFSGAGADEVLEPSPGEQPLWERVRLEALFDTEVDLGSVRRQLEADGARLLDIEIVEDSDWQERWRAYAVRQLFAGRLWVLPRDEPVPDGASGIPVLRLDPGLAFGSGSHPTTRLCLERLAALPLVGKRVLDFGCGSGILALAACLLGAREVVAIDHDPQALAATRENAEFNAVADSVLRVGDTAALYADGHDRAPFDVVVANILANPLVELAPLLGGLVAPGGLLLLSGLLAEQEQLIRDAYPGVHFDPAARDEDWIRLDGTVY